MKEAILKALETILQAKVEEYYKLAALADSISHPSMKWDVERRIGNTCEQIDAIEMRLAIIRLQFMKCQTCDVSFVINVRPFFNGDAFDGYYAECAGCGSTKFLRMDTAVPRVKAVVGKAL